MPVGTILNYPGTVAPAGFELCIGQTALRSDYIALVQWAIENNVIGQNKLFGNGDGNTTFEFPDLREVVLVGSGKNERYVFDNTELDPGTGTQGTQNHDIYAVGEFKDDSLQNITGTLGRVLCYGTGAFKPATGDYHIRAENGSVDGSKHDVTFDASRVARTGTVTHGKQIGINYIIKI
ncbi:MAG: tail fiber protein [Treponema sp.]|nr:tail fiber protein [Treponema sp.]